MCIWMVKPPFIHYIPLALTLALCLGLTVPAFAAAIDGITITANPNGTLSYAALAK